MSTAGWEIWIPPVPALLAVDTFFGCVLQRAQRRIVRRRHKIDVTIGGSSQREEGDTTRRAYSKRAIADGL